MSALQTRIEQQADRLTTTRKECHRRRLLLLAQQQLMDAGPQTYHRCPHCPKAFINASFLNAHLHRRHAELVNALQTIDFNQQTHFEPFDDSKAMMLKERAGGEASAVLVGHGKISHI